MISFKILNLIISAKTVFPNKVTSSSVRMWTYFLGGPPFNWHCMRDHYVRKRTRISGAKENELVKENCTSWDSTQWTYWSFIVSIVMEPLKVNFLVTIKCPMAGLHLQLWNHWRWRDLSSFLFQVCQCCSFWTLLTIFGKRICMELETLACGLGLKAMMESSKKHQLIDYQSYWYSFLYLLAP